MKIWRKLCKHRVWFRKRLSHTVTDCYKYGKGVQHLIRKISSHFVHISPTQITVGKCLWLTQVVWQHNNVGRFETGRLGGNFLRIKGLDRRKRLMWRISYFLFFNDEDCSLQTTVARMSIWYTPKSVRTTRHLVLAYKYTHKIPQTYRLATSFDFKMTDKNHLKIFNL